MNTTPDAELDPAALVARAMAAVAEWEAEWGPFERHRTLAVGEDRLSEALAELGERLHGNYPFFHPRYAGQMLKPPHPVAIAAYAAAMRINPNNHALDGGPPTGLMEKEVVRDLAAMFGLPDETLGHLTGGGTMANLEALFVARELHPDRGIAVSEDAHYTHARMAHVLRMPVATIPVMAGGRIDLDALEDRVARGDIGTVVLTPGSTGLGAVDDIHEALALRDRHGLRIHVDAAYGGFFTLLAGTDAPADFPAEAFRAIGACDSVAVDPHKHGLQPYGCGCILFRDPRVGRFYRHDSPYTYFTSDDLHLGEISLECSRPGAAAAALWLTLRCLPLRRDEGLGPILAACVRASRGLAERIDASERFRLLVPPRLDIVTFLPEAPTLSSLDRASADLFDRAMHDRADPVFLSLYRVDNRRLGALHPDIAADGPHARVLRSVLMKPEHEHAAGWLHGRLEALAASAG